MEAYRQAAEELHRYPDGGSTGLRATLGRHHGLAPDRIVCGNGSDELLGLLARAYAGPGDEIIHTSHGFLIYPIIARSVGAVPVAVAETELTANVDAILAAAGEKTRIVFLANPNNPTGTYISAAEVARLRAGLAEATLLVLDAAYAEYVGRNDYEPGIEMVNSHTNVVMARTFSKIYGLAALRVGWVYCPDEIADILNRMRGPFNVSAPGMAAAAAAIDDIAHRDRARALNDEGLPWFSAQCNALGLTAVPSVANFVLVRFADETSAGAARGFLADHKIRARAMGGYGLPDCIRFTIGRREDMERVVEMLAAFLEGPEGKGAVEGKGTVEGDGDG